MEDLESLVEAYAQRRGLWEDNTLVLTACSGGPDSMALLSVLCRISEKSEGNLRVAAAHFNHGIRGQEADHDEEYVWSFCFEHDIPYYAGRGDVPAYADEHNMSIETAAREMRYAFLYGTAEKIGAARIAVAHQANDQAETVLMRILRGTGVEGLAAIRPKNGILIRPLLFASRDSIEKYCESRGITPCMDSTNEYLDATRNKLRLSLIPQLKKEYNPMLGEALCRLAAIAADQTDYIAQQEVEARKSVVRSETERKVVFSRQLFLGLHETMQMAVLRTAVQNIGGSMKFSYVLYEALKNLFLPGHTGKELHLPCGLHAWANAEEVILSAENAEPVEWEEKPLTVPGITHIDELGLSVSCENTSYEGPSGSRSEIFIDAEMLSGAKVRMRKNGDRFSAGGGSQTVKKLLIDRKIPRDRRNEIPIVEANGQILWIAGIRQSDAARPKIGGAAVRMKLIYDKMPEWLRN